MTDTNEQAQVEPEITTATAEPTQTAEPPAAPTPEPAPEPEAPAPSEDDGNDPAEEAQPKKKGGGFQNRIDQLTREKHEANLRLQAAERKVAEMEKQIKPDLAAEPGPEPKLEEFETIDGFTKAHSEWAKREGYRQALSEGEARKKEQERFAAIATMNAREDAARAKYADYDRMVSPVAPAILGNETLLGYVMDSEAGAEVSYHLAKNPAVLFELTKLPPIAAMRELVKLEARLAAPPPEKPMTKAPPPVKPVGSNETVAKTMADYAASDDIGEYVARRNKARGKT